MLKNNILSDIGLKYPAPCARSFKIVDKWLILAFVFSIGALINIYLCGGMLLTLLKSAKVPIIWIQLTGFLLLPAGILTALALSSILVPAKHLLKHKLLLRRWRWHMIPEMLKFLLKLQLLIIPVMIGTKILFKMFGIEFSEPAINELLKSCTWTEFALFAFIAVAVAPLTEELMFRRILFGFFYPWTGRLMAFTATSILFACVHDAPVMWPALFILGAGMQLVYLRSRSLYPAIILHVFNNSIAVCLISFIRFFPDSQLAKMIG
ncbi:MAG: CPBP family intramembrane metalloprotease [Victivallales bacterium]|nr:CPBP family intramembrane metalloprotease [Victivallales bacterium]